MRKSTIEISSEAVLFEGKFIRVIGRNFNQNGKTGLWECVKRKTYGRIVAIAAITPDRELILCKVFRVPINGWIVELCAGLMDRPGETEESLAAKELLEETGYQAASITHLMTGHFNAGLLADEMAVYLGHNAVKVAEPKLEVGEDIEVLKIPITHANEWLSNPPDGLSIDMKIFSIIYHPEVQKLIR